MATDAQKRQKTAIIPGTSLYLVDSSIFGIKYLVFDTFEIFCMKYL